MTPEELELVERYMPLINAELRRIGFTDDDFRMLGSGGGHITRDALEGWLADLKKIPPNIGAIAYYARFGVGFAAVKRDVEEREGRWGIDEPG